MSFLKRKLCQVDMLKPREADIPVLFMVLVVLPVIIYIILGKWNDTSKKAAKANILAQLAAEESFREEVMASADILPVVPLWKNDTHVCAKCYAPATSRCSRCKSVGYCSGKCQIVHWRQGHKEECQQWQNGVVNFSAGRGSITDSIHRGSITDVSRDFNGSYTKQHQHSSVHSDEASYWRTDAPTVTHPERNLSDNGLRIRGRPKREMLSDEASIIVGTNNTCADARLVDGSSPDTLLQDALFEVESGPGNFTETNEHQKYDSTGIQNNGSTVRNSASQSQRLKDENKSIPNVAELRKSTGEATSSFKQRYPTGSHENATNGGEAGKNFISYEDRFSSSFVTSGLRPSAEENLVKRNLIYKKPPYILDPDKSVARAPRQCQSQVTNGGIPPSVPTSSPEQCFKGITNGKEMTLKTSRTSSRNPKSRLVGLINGYKRNKLLFPYEEIVKLFQCDVSGISPRGLLNCGNSCYANAVLQCLTFTKPIMVYLLHRSHSRTCRITDWCLMCELEQHIAELLEGGGPLSPSKILSNMSDGCRIGGGKQEDAHEFLRLLVMSMQAVCLRDLGGEKKVDPGLQETTLVQQIFGGRLKSKVKCLRCHHESERYENIMDLTLEIYGWVESLEDALTQFTAPEDLDGENMYRCGRCSTYVRARKQLSLHEVPNILTIVLKRFQTGKYGKINKCVTFPDLLDMIPFVTGSADSPPLYILYAVVVHLDTLNTSFSGHYVSYVKDIQGTWFRIDDSEVQVVPLSQVMSEGAYMLFYSRSFPRPPSVCINRALLQAPSLMHNSLKSLKSSRHGQPEETETCPLLSNAEKNSRPEKARSFFSSNEIHTDTVISTDFSDPTSSDWSLFTSSDESSFTTESTRNSFSTVDHEDSGVLDPISSIFGSFYRSDCSQGSTISCTNSSLRV
ncbi:ubiquitin carboxyl-terminal hydrolase 15 isoform X1 [Dendrobium catenatum]|uniref:ubiquitin carboxyl-terminal hydrolase 15 isoform X1 n=1 Tax=Dendrobium catenatum TaxID=906689 RepID=UPI0009F65F05|nr:ubiquitin carboxyl-terminal hydrolase 15 isoform X1 [Dendrobium catenatum]XP_020705754.1 ubiquitin carboxyl-terminal hydrolase 15 isoform X1 [Dendrobium catenatum]XP_028553604.1 ubiquitin carboxyl-terminal hydrolase 15 isoform X1 [Dendrobium catenatum]XP_028553605.1 ubiquitin carboxyl-terminal hydrolase 15 isoform X1 [Dendrobium catenatum]